MKKITRYEMRGTGYENGSALILAVVLTSLLAIVGVLFLMISRVDRIATSAISQNRELDMAVDAVIARIAEELALDVPGNSANLGGEYYDYPDVNNAWLASLEPYEFGGVGSGDYIWRLSDLSDIYGFELSELSGFPPEPQIIPDYQNPERVGHTRVGDTYPADADGDGVSDSWWVELPNITSGKGWPIYAAIRVIDNGAMLNVNTAYADPGGPDTRAGDMLTDIYINGLVKWTDDPGPETRIYNFIANRDNNPINADTYYLEVSRRIDNPDFSQGHIYTLYDISEELSLRNRFILFPDGTMTRLEAGSAGDPDSCFSTTLRWTGYGNSYTPYTDLDFDAWERRFDPYDVGEFGADPNSNNCDFRHLLTTYNMDRIISPDGEKMLNVNTLVPTNETLRIIRAALLDANPGFVNVGAVAAQIAANLIDFRDDDEIVTAVVDDTDVALPNYYGFERPCIYISELAYSVNDVNHMSYAIELYKPYFEDNDPCGWQLVIDGDPCTITITWLGSRRFHIIKWEDPGAPPLGVSFSEPDGPNPVDGALWVDPEVILGWRENVEAKEYNLYLGAGFDDVNNADKDANELIANKLSDNNYPIVDYNADGLEPETTYYWRVDGVNFVNPNSPWKGEVWKFMTGPNDYNYSELDVQFVEGWSYGTPVFAGGSVIKLRRFADNGDPVVVDSIQVPGWLVEGQGPARSYQRDITRHKCIRRLWDPNVKTPTLGHSNIFEHPDASMIQAHPENTNFVGIGDIGKVFAVDACGVGPLDTEADVRINLADLDFQQIFNYLTVFDPTSDDINNDGDLMFDGSNWVDRTDENELSETPEWKVPGRININTAPWYVIAQLPWMTPEIAQAIVAYRDKLNLRRRRVDYSREPTGRGTGMVDVDDVLPVLPPAVVREAPGFASIAELLNVTHDLTGESVYVPQYDIRTYGRDTAIDQREFPDLTPEDGAADDLEERDLIFARISNLVTVRSDVFTAYILIRIGTDGPQKRVIAILDRSNVYADGAGGVTGSVRVRALHPVPDPR